MTVPIERMGMARLEDLTPGARVRGVAAGADIEVVNVKCLDIRKTPMTKTIYLANPYGFSAQQKIILSRR